MPQLTSQKKTELQGEAEIHPVSSSFVLEILIYGEALFGLQGLKQHKRCSVCKMQYLAIMQMPSLLMDVNGPHMNANECVEKN